MNRDIKFEYLCIKSHGYILKKIFTLSDIEKGYVELWKKYNLVGNSIIHQRQFTGLQDRRGNSIYEGDLVRIPAKDKYEEKTFNCFEVFYHDNECIGGQNIGFCINRMHSQGYSGGGQGYKFTPQSMRDFEIIGNIHENSDLLK